MFKYFFFLLFFYFHASAAVINVSGVDEDVSILQYSDVYIEKNASFDTNKSVVPKAGFQPYDSDFISRGYTTNEAVWVRFSLKNTTDKSLERVLHIDNSMFDSVTLYDDTGKIGTVGTLFRPLFDGTIDPYFMAKLEPNSQKTFYLRILANSCATYFHINSETTWTFWRKTNLRQLILAGFFSAVATLLIYNTFLFIFTREKIYALYVLFLFFTSWNHFSYTSLTIPFLSIFISNENLILFSEAEAYLGLHYAVLQLVFIILFVREFMSLYKIRRIDMVLKLSIFACFIIMLISSQSSYMLDILIVFMLFVLTYILAVAFYLVYKKEENSLYFLVGWGVSLSGTILFLLYNFGYYVPKNGYWYFYEMSLAFEALLFSVILSRKLNRAKALEISLSTQKILVGELHHRVKNNLQFIVSLYRLKLRKHLDTIGKVMLGEAEQNIRSIGKIHEILYAKQDIAALSAKEYFSELIEEIKHGYPAKNIEISLNGDAQIDIEQAIYCGLIVNELVTNALKYAFGEEGGSIAVTLEENSNGKLLIIGDNGKGFDVSAPRNSFGLSLVERLVNDELGGTLDTVSENGVSHTIRWR